MEGIPEEREKEVVNNIVKGKENFYKYVSFVLSEEHVVSMMELNEHISNEKTGHTPSGSLQPALYEKLLKAAATNPNKLDGIDYMIKMLSEAQGSDIEDFKKLYKMVKGAIQ